MKKDVIKNVFLFHLYYTFGSLFIDINNFIDIENNYDIKENINLDEISNN